MKADKDYTIAEWNRLVGERGADALKLAESRAEFVAVYQRDVMAGKVQRAERSLTSEGEALFDRYVRPERDRRAKGKHGFAENIATSILGNADPHLDLAVPIGDGTDKVLRFWTRKDWMYSITSRERSAQDAVDASNEHKAYALRVIAAMDDNEAAYTGDLFDSTSKAAA